MGHIYARRRQEVGKKRAESERKLENLEHSGIAQGIRLDSLEVQEFRHTLVVRTKQFGIHIRLNRRALDDLETMASEKLGLES